MLPTLYAGVNASDLNIAAGVYEAFKQAGTGAPELELGGETSSEVVAVGPGSPLRREAWGFVGVESCVDAVEHLHSGKNIGKVLVQVAKDL